MSHFTWFLSLLWLRLTHMTNWTNITPAFVQSLMLLKIVIKLLALLCLILFLPNTHLVMHCYRNYLTIMNLCINILWYFFCITVMNLLNNGETTNIKNQKSMNKNVWLCKKNNNLEVLCKWRSVEETSSTGAPFSCLEGKSIIQALCLISRLRIFKMYYKEMLRCRYFCLWNCLEMRVPDSSIYRATGCSANYIRWSTVNDCSALP